MEKYLVIATLSVFAVLSAAEKCLETDQCVCKTPSGSRSVDLRPLKGKSFSDIDKAKKFTYFFSPCGPLLKPQKCVAKNPTLAVCQEADTEYDAGDADTSIFSGDVDYNLTITYTSKDGTRTSHVTLVCSGDTRLQFMSENPTNTYNFQFHQPYICLGTEESGLSTGSVLVILFFVFFVAYWVGGFLFMKFVRKAEGPEMIPNYEFWKELPLLIRDGVMFTLRGCKGESTYEKI